MIKINLADQNKKDVENIFRKWFFNRKANINDFRNIVDKDWYLQKIIFKDQEYINWIKCLDDKNTSLKEKKKHQKVIEDFFFADFSNKEITNKYVVRDLKLKDETIQFFKQKYKNFRKSQGAKVVRALNIKVCPYCNRNYIEMYNFKDNNGTVNHRFKGELDHYYSQSKYPHLSLSLFNLIPCCKGCNHEKLDIEAETFHPYYHSEVDNYKFTLRTLTAADTVDITFEEKIEDLDSKINDLTYLQGTSDNFKISIVPTNDDYADIIKNSNSVFKLEKKYNNSKDYVKEILKKKYIYNDSYSKMLSENFNTIFKEPSDVKNFIFSTELNGTKHNERPLSKLTYDILKELHII